MRALSVTIADTAGWTTRQHEVTCVRLAGRL